MALFRTSCGVLALLAAHGVIGFAAVAAQPGAVVRANEPVAAGPMRNASDTHAREGVGFRVTLACDETECVTALSPTQAVLRLVTSAPATIDIEASLRCGQPGIVTSGDSLGDFNPAIPGYEHEIIVAGLFPGDEYFFAVTATDLDDNTATLPGGCVDIVMPQEFRFSVEQFNNAGSPARPFDLEFSSVELRPVQGVLERGSKATIYAATRRDIDRLPVDPSGGIAIFPFDPSKNFDDAYEFVPFADSRLFTLHDLASSETFGGVYIGSNGFVTFGEGDTSPTPSLQGMYAFARVSGVWANLDPERGGTVTYKQLADRFVATWQDVPRRLQFDSNTFQIELRFDGVIVLSWLGVGAPSTIVGVAPSNGKGGGLGAVPSGFVPTDFSNTAFGVGPTPPNPVSRIARSTAGAPVVLKLRASDDGLPYGFLRYKVLSLPSVGALVDAGTGEPITTADLPYTLAGFFGDTLRFEPPSPKWEGEAYFDFVADDTWPDAPPPWPALPSQSSVNDPIPNDGESVPGRILIRSGERRLIRSFLVDDTLDTAGWTGFNPGRWEFGQPTGGSSQPNSNDPTSGFTGENVIGFNLLGDYENNIPAQRLTSPAIDCTEYTGVRLRFMRWLCAEVDDGARLEVSTDATDWENATIWSLPLTAALLDRGWRMVEYDISAIADGESTVYLRWTMGPTDTSGRFAGWNIDDIILDGFTEVECPFDVNADGVVNAGDVFSILSRLGLVDAPDTHDVNGDGVVDTDDLALVLAGVGVSCR